MTTTPHTSTIEQEQLEPLLADIERNQEAIGCNIRNLQRAVAVLELRMSLLHSRKLGHDLEQKQVPVGNLEDVEDQSNELPQLELVSSSTQDDLILRTAEMPPSSNYFLIWMFVGTLLGTVASFLIPSYL